MSAQIERFGRHAVRALVGILTLAAGALTLGAAHAQQPAAWQSVDSIRAAARNFVLQSIGASGSVTVATIAIDERLKMPACSVPLTAQSQNALRNGHGTVAVSCAGAQPWRLFVPVRAVAEVDALVVTRSIGAGEVIAAGDLQQSRRSSASLPYDYMTDPAQAIGLTARRTLPAGAVLVPGALSQPRLIERGALVTLIAGSGPIVVRTEGVALEPAKLNERVRVRSASGRVVEGVAESATEVRVGS